ncbi:hypothetical protein JD969_15475 [Planctomycetota bacterium]|nr:hypothetical protein JD969_15475 [Planctomycetota bacterium]
MPPHNFPPIPPKAPVIDGHITKDISCTQCAYNLRTLNINNTCPECGHSIRKTILTRYATNAPHYWPHHIQFSQSNAIFLSPIASLICLLLFTQISPLHWPIPDNLSNFFCALYVSIIIIALVTLGISVFGINALVSQSPQIPAHILNSPHRKKLRRTNISLVILTILIPITYTIILALLVANGLGMIYSGGNVTGAAYNYVNTSIITNIITPPLVLAFLFTLSSRITCYHNLTAQIAQHFNLSYTKTFARTLAIITKITFSILITITLLFTLSAVFEFLINHDHLFHKYFIASPDDQTKPNYQLPSHLLFITNALYYYLLVALFLMSIIYALTIFSAIQIRTAAKAAARIIYPLTIN